MRTNPIWLATRLRTCIRQSPAPDVTWDFAGISPMSVEVPQLRAQTLLVSAYDVPIASFIILLNAY
jgi:hypothetical protein